STRRQRVIGYVVWSPPIALNTKPHGSTNYFCVIKLDNARFLPNFKGNVIDLGIHSNWFVSKMYHAQPGFEYPAERLLELKDILTEDHMRHPNMQDPAGEQCLYVIKRGLTSLTTIGRASGLLSFAREYFPNQTHRDSIEWAILPYDLESLPFSEKGDSGAMVACITGEFGGLITGGTGRRQSADITYATPMFSLWPIIKARFPRA
ncbi:hypothetical protein GGX14DRAFT_678221, partial [Mycena pura]